MATFGLRMRLKKSECLDTCTTNLITPGSCACWRTNDSINTAIREEGVIQWNNNSGETGLVVHGYFKSLPANTDGSFIFNNDLLFNSTASKILMGLFDSEDVLNARTLDLSIDSRYWYATGNSEMAAYEKNIQVKTPIPGAYLGAKEFIIKRTAGVIQYYTGTTLRYTSPNTNNNEMFAFFIGEDRGYRAVNVRIELN